LDRTKGTDVKILEGLAWLEDRIGTLLIYAIIFLTSV